MKPVIPQTLPKHALVHERLVQLLGRDEHVQGVVMSGSVVSGTPDAFSDLDYTILASEPEFQVLYDQRSDLVRSVGEVVTCFDANHLPFPNHIFVSFLEVGGSIVKVDLDYSTVQDFLSYVRKDPRPRQVVLDRSGSLVVVVPECSEQVIPQISHETLLDMNSKFWGWIWYVYGKVMRGELYEALDGLGVIHQRILNALILDLLGKPNEGYRRVEKRYSKEYLDAFHQLHQLPTREGLETSLRGTIELYTKVRREVEEKRKLRLDNVREKVILENLLFKAGAEGKEEKGEQD